MKLALHDRAVMAWLVVRAPIERLGAKWHPPPLDATDGNSGLRLRRLNHLGPSFDDPPAVVNDKFLLHAEFWAGLHGQGARVRETACSRHEYAKRAFQVKWPCFREFAGLLEEGTEISTLPAGPSLPKLMRPPPKPISQQSRCGTSPAGQFRARACGESPPLQTAKNWHAPPRMIG